MAARGGGRGGAAAEQLPLGAVRTEDGQVVIPASTRADGSTRKAIRIRQGYVPQDEIAAYKTPAQRRREEEQRRRTVKQPEDGGDELSLGSLSLQDAPARQQRPASSASARAKSSNADRQANRSPRSAPSTEGKSAAARGERGSAKQRDGDDRQAQLKKDITRINRLLKDIAKLEAGSQDELSDTQQKKVARKQDLQREKNDIIAELNGATVDRTDDGAGKKSRFCAISL